MNSAVVDERRLIIYRSNRLESLLDCLAEQLRHDPPPPLTTETVVVQSRGMATWLGQSLARRFGVWANPGFPHPRRFIERLLRSALGPEVESAASFNRELLTLAILELLPGIVDQEEFSPLRRYLEGGDDWKSLQLAERIAYLFDQYLVYRPDMVLGWEEQREQPDRENLWQAVLWRQLANRYGSPARLFHQAHARLKEGNLQAPELLPSRVFLFGITTLPPIYLGLLNEAAKLIPCHLLLFSPAQEYWADIYTPRAVNRLLLRYQEQGAGTGELHLETGHPLLAALGTVGREFQEIVEEQAEYDQPAAGECFVNPATPATMETAGCSVEINHRVSPVSGQGVPQDAVPRDRLRSVLARLQRDILELRHPGLESGQDPSPVDTTDHSVVIHSCHSPLREVEILQDQILAMLDQEGYRPRDIVVMVPDIETYAPLIEAVFRRPAADRRYIPFRISDRKISREAPLIDALLELFELVRGRLPLSRVMDFLSREPVRRGFGLDGQQLQRLEQWLEQVRVRWGIDEEHRKHHDQPPDRQNTWRFGLDRLILGYALPGEDRRLVAGILPFDDIEGQDAQLAGVLLKFTSALFALTDEVRHAKTPAQWTEVVRRALAAFFAPEERAAAGEEWQRQSLRDALAALLQDSDQAGLERPLELPAFLRLLRTRLDEAGGSAGFLEGGLTFCNMLPMRTIPFPVVCLLGLNDGAFPRQDNPAGFDLMAASPRPGDRSRRRDDRYLFLESLLSARHRFYISYVGRSIKDNAELPPSPLVDELLDCLALMTTTGDDTHTTATAAVGEAAGTGATHTDARQQARARFVIEHPLQPFSPRYFQSGHPLLFTYAAEYAPPKESGAASPVRSPETPAEPETPADHSRSPAGPTSQGAETDSLTLADLHRFFRNPAKWYARHHLGLDLPPAEESRPDREPVFLEGLDKYHLNHSLLRSSAALPAAATTATTAAATAEPGDEPARRLLRLLAARGELPLAGAAGSALAETVADIEPVAAFLATGPVGRPLPDLTLELDLGNHLHLGGKLRDRAESGLLRWTAGKTKPVFFLLAWLDHLALCAQNPADQVQQCFMVGRGDKKNGKTTADIRLFQKLDQSRALTLLAQLVSLWRRGREEPLPFFPASSHAWCQKIHSAKTGDLQKLQHQARVAALTAYHGGDYIRSEGADPYLGMIFQEAQPAGQWRENENEGPGGADWEDFVAVAETVYGPMLRALEKPRAQEP